VPKGAKRREGSHWKLAEDAVARLDRSWPRNGDETLNWLTARPEVYLKTMVRLVAVLHRRLPEPPGFDRQRARADVLQRVQELARKT
jgi:hypothetical protein